MIITVTLTPALDKTVILPNFTINHVNRIDSLRLDPGGKGINVSKVVRVLGGQSLATGIVGGETGRYIQACLAGDGIAHDFVTVDEATRTNLKIIDPVNHTNTDINEPGAPVSPHVLDEVFAKICSRLTQSDLVVLAGKVPQGVPDTLFSQWISALREKGAKVYLDADDSLLANGVNARPHLIKPNEEELSRLMGREVTSEADMLDAAKALIDEGIQTIVISMGGKGALFVNQREALYGHGLKVPVLSTVGAGDAMMAAMCYGEAWGMDFDKTCQTAMAVSAASVMCSGTQAPSSQAIESLLDKVRLEKRA